MSTSAALNHLAPPCSYLSPLLPTLPGVTLQLSVEKRRFHPGLSTLSSRRDPFRKCDFGIVACISSSTSRRFVPSTRLFVSGLSFRTTEKSLRNAFINFGDLVEVHLVMDNIANRPRGFAFVRYATEEESKKAIDGMHGKFLDGRVIFVEIAKSKAELHQR